MNRRKTWAVLIVIIIIAGVIAALTLLGAIHPSSGGNAALGGAEIRVVAAENFYGSIASQIGGDKVAVTSILSDPSADPHEYESNVADAIAVADADIVIENGLGYDSWMDKLISASPNGARMLIVAANTVPNVLANNPHVWYDLNDAKAIAESIASALEKIDGTNAPLFAANLASFENSLQSAQHIVDDIKTNYGGTPIGLTETIGLYQTAPMNLNVITPASFERAIAEGNDPSAADMNLVNQQIAGGQIKVLVYNSQTVTPVTTNLENAAVAKNIPLVPFSETMPKNDTYQQWMADQLGTLERALAAAAGR